MSRRSKTGTRRSRVRSNPCSVGSARSTENDHDLPMVMARLDVAPEQDRHTAKPDPFHSLLELPWNFGIYSRCQATVTGFPGSGSTAQLSLMKTLYSPPGLTSNAIRFVDASRVPPRVICP